MKHFYGSNPECELLELGALAAYAYDELFAIEKRLCAASGVPADPVRRQMAWQADIRRRRREDQDASAELRPAPRREPVAPAR